MTLVYKQLKASRFGFGEGLVEAGKKNGKVVVIGADISASVCVDMFAREFPDRFISLGIAEQNCVGVAAGLALGGKIPVFSTYGVFAALRTTDQIRISLCYNNLHVIIGGAHAGISVGPDGATHQALEDLAIMRSLPNMTVLSPCDATQAKLATEAAIEKIKGPVYIRFGREPIPDFTHDTDIFEPGKAQLFKDGKDITVIATGILTWEALVAAHELEKQGISVRVINLHTIKPVDEEIIIKAAMETGKIITAEEHQIYGGMGSAVAEVVVKHHPVQMEFIGIKDHFGESGKPSELMNKYGLNSENIIQKIKIMLNK